MNNAERIERDLWNGGGSSGSVSIPKEVSDSINTLTDFVAQMIPDGEELMIDLGVKIAEMLDNYDPTPYAIAFDGRPMSRDEFSTSA